MFGRSVVLWRRRKNYFRIFIFQSLYFRSLKWYSMIKVLPERKQQNIEKER
jgi:hypothetical protein